MTRSRLLLVALLLGAADPAALAQTFTPQSPAGLSVSFSTEKAGGTRVLVFGEVRNSSLNPAQHVIVAAEGLDETGRVVSRGRSYVPGIVPTRGSAPFEIRVNSSGSERRYRVLIESYEFVAGGGGG